MRVRVERCGHMHKPMRRDPEYANESHVPLCRLHCDERRGDVRGAVRRIHGTDPAWHTSFGHERNDGGEAAKYASYGPLAAFLAQGVYAAIPTVAESSYAPSDGFSRQSGGRIVCHLDDDGDRKGETRK